MALVRFRRLFPDAILPTRATDGSAGYDLFASHNIVVPPNGYALVETGLAVELPPGIEMQIRTRSGLALKHITVANSPGTIDPDYRGEIRVILRCGLRFGYQVHKGDRIAQAVFAPYLTPTFEEVDELGETTRGDGGFGSTGR